MNLHAEDSINDTLHILTEYKEFFTQIKNQVRSSRLQAALAVNSEVIKLYWYIGNEILKRQQATNWGSKLIETLSDDLRRAFPETSGFSAPNLKRMKLFAQLFPSTEIGSQAVIQLPWGHIITIIHKVKDEIERAWYIRQTLQQGWKRATLERNIDQNLFKRQALESNKCALNRIGFTLLNICYRKVHVLVTH